jgi:DNA-binding transcriptional MerR regulator
MKPDTGPTLTIGRLGARAAVEPKTLRYYDRVGLVRPAARTPAGYRVYREDAVERLSFIRRAKALRISLADIRRILAVRDEGAAPCQHVLALVRQNLTTVEAQITQLAHLRTDLRRFQRLLKDKVPADAKTADECPCYALIKEFEGVSQQPARRREGHQRSRSRSG